MVESYNREVWRDKEGKPAIIMYDQWGMVKVHVNQIRGLLTELGWEKEQ